MNKTQVLPSWGFFISLVRKILYLVYKVLHKNSQYLSVCPSVPPYIHLPLCIPPSFPPSPRDPTHSLYVPPLPKYSLLSRPPDIFSFPQKIFLSILKCYLHTKPWLIRIFLPFPQSLAWLHLSPLPISALTTHKPAHLLQLVSLTLLKPPVSPTSSLHLGIHKAQREPMA